MPLPAKILLGLLAVIIILALVWLAIPDNANNNMNEPADTNAPATSGNEADNKSPDPVKESGPPSGDIAPSRSGTGPGPEEDLISQPGQP